MYHSWKDGLEHKVEYLGNDGSTLLRKLETTWQQTTTPTWWIAPADLAPSNNPRIVETTTTFADVSPNLVTKRSVIDPNNPNFVGYDQYNNPTDVWEYDYGQGAPGALLRGVDGAAGTRAHACLVQLLDT
jgi:hypothetical protein